MQLIVGTTPLLDPAPLKPVVLGVLRLLFVMMTDGAMIMIVGAFR